jgi:hypothetical protein
VISFSIISIILIISSIIGTLFISYFYDDTTDSFYEYLSNKLTNKENKKNNIIIENITNTQKNSTEIIIERHNELKSKNKTCEYNFDCNDDNVTTQDFCDTQKNECFNFEILSCIDNDGYCPSFCDKIEDSDCRKNG